MENEIKKATPPQEDEAAEPKDELELAQFKDLDNIVDKVYGQQKPTENTHATLENGKVMLIMDKNDFDLLQRRQRARLGVKRKRVKPKVLPVPYERIRDVVFNWHTTGLKESFKFLFILAYLTGARISEMLQLRRMDFSIEEIEGRKFLAVQILTLKEHRSNLLRKILVPADGYEFELVRLFVNDFLSQFYDKEKVFSMKRIAAWKKFSKINIGPVQGVVETTIGAQVKYFDKYPCFPHFMRHCRLTHLKKKYGFDDQYLMRWAGWASTQMAAEYVHVSAEDFALKMNKEITAQQKALAEHNPQTSNTQALMV